MEAAPTNTKKENAPDNLCKSFQTNKSKLFEWFRLLGNYLFSAGRGL